VIKRREFLKYSSSGLVGTALLNSCQSHNHQKNINTGHPNLIMIIADDLRWDCLGKFNPIIQTPNLDQLANGGVVYLNNFVTTSICATSRASIFTGLYARHHGIWDFDTALTKQQWCKTYHYLLKQAGYNTAFIGKWGLGGQLPLEEFDYWGGFAGQGNYYTKTRQEHLTSYLTSQAEDFIAQQKHHFCLTLSHKAPHTDEDTEQLFIPEAKFAQQYQDLVIPEYRVPGDSDWLPEFLQQTEAQTRYAQSFQTAASYQESVKNYYRLISGIDESVARIIQAVKQQNFTQDTYIIFTSDNGFFLGEKGFAGKWFGFEPAIRTPLIISCVNQPLASLKIVSDMSLNIDIAPTIIKLAKIASETDLFQVGIYLPNNHNLENGGFMNIYLNILVFLATSELEVYSTNIWHFSTMITKCCLSLIKIRKKTQISLNAIAIRKSLVTIVS
jgi:arylsulfatase A-like enzyme